MGKRKKERKKKNYKRFEKKGGKEAGADFGMQSICWADFILLTVVLVDQLEKG